MTGTTQEKNHWDKGAATYISDAFTNQIVDLLLEELQPGKTLEIGAGRGRITSELARYLELRLYGIDISSKMLDYAPKDRVKYKTNDGRTIPYPDQYFENIYSVTVFQHIPDGGAIKYIHEAYRTLKPGGILFIQFIEGEYKGKFDNNIPESDMRFWLTDAGFKVLDVLHGYIHPHWTWIKAVK